MLCKFAFALRAQVWLLFWAQLVRFGALSQGVLQNIWLVLHDRGWIEIADIKLRTSYPILPWIGVILLGYALGQFFSSKYTAKQRGRVLLSLGLASIGLFVLLRFINVW